LPQRYADEGNKRPLHPRQANACALGLSWFPAFAGMTARLAPNWTARMMFILSEKTLTRFALQTTLSHFMGEGFAHDV